MKPAIRKLALACATLGLVGVMAGCTPEQKTAILQLCEQNPVECEQVMKTLAERKAPQPKVEAHYMTREEAPSILVSWADTQRNSRTPADRLFTTEANTYVAVTGGLVGSGGYQIRAERVYKEGDTWIIEVKLIPPTGPATDALSNPVAYFRFPKLDGKTVVTWASESTITANAGWQKAGLLKVTGTAKNMADIHLEAVVDAEVVSRADAQVKDGYFEANLIVPGNPKVLTLTFSTVDPVAPKIVHTMQVLMPKGGFGPVDPGPQKEYTSANFRVVQPWLIDESTIQIEGKARAFEAMFRVEVWANGKMLAAKPVMAKEGAPEYGAFSDTIGIKGGVPKGAEVRFRLENMKDGSFTTELTLPVAGH